MHRVACYQYKEQSMQRFAVGTLLIVMGHKWKL